MRGGATLTREYLWNSASREMHVNVAIVNKAMPCDATVTVTRSFCSNTRTSSSLEALHPSSPIQPAKVQQPQYPQVSRTSRLLQNHAHSALSMIGRIAALKSDARKIQSRLDKAGMFCEYYCVSDTDTNFSILEIPMQCLYK